MRASVAAALLAIVLSTASAQVSHGASALELAFLSERHGGTSLMLAGAMGIKTIDRHAAGPPAWFHDGRRLAYARDAEFGPATLRLLTVGGRQRGHGLYDCVRGRIAVAPDGRSLICESYPEAQLFTHVELPPGGGTTTLSRHGTGGYEHPAWSTDGTIALVPAFEAPLLLYRLAWVSHELRLRPIRKIEYPPSGSPSDPDFSPDGRLLAFSTTDREIWLADVRSGKLVRRITRRGWSPSWSPDGQRIAFVSERHGDTEIYTIHVDGTNVRRVTFSRGRDTEPAWRPRVR